MSRRGGGQRKKEPRQYITPSAVRRGRPAKIAITPAESNEIKLHYLACHGAINHTPFSRPSPRRAPSAPVPRRRRPPVGRSFRIPVYTCVCGAYVCYRSRCPGPVESADEDEEDSIWRDLRDRSLADAKKSRPLNPSSKMEVADEAERRTVAHRRINCPTRTYLFLHI